MFWRTLRLFFGLSSLTIWLATHRETLFAWSIKALTLGERECPSFLFQFWSTSSWSFGFRLGYFFFFFFSRRRTRYPNRTKEFRVNQGHLSSELLNVEMHHRIKQLKNLLGKFWLRFLFWFNINFIKHKNREGSPGSHGFQFFWQSLGKKIIWMRFLQAKKKRNWKQGTDWKKERKQKRRAEQNPRIEKPLKVVSKNRVLLPNNWFNKVRTLFN